MDNTDMPGKDDLVETFELDELGEQLKKDDLEAVKDRYLSQQHSEICAYYGSNKCLLYMLEKGMTISPLVNLYAIRHGRVLQVSVPHPDELYMLVTCSKLHIIPYITLPSVDIIVETFYRLNDEFDLPLEEALRLVRARVDDNAWNKMSQESVVKMVEIDRAEYLTDCNIYPKTLRKIIQSGLEHICCKAGHAYRKARAAFDEVQTARARKPTTE